VTDSVGAGRRVAELLPSVVGWVLVALGMWSTLRGLGRPLGPYDEGILLTDAYLVSLGQVPYRDFYSNYPPGAYLAIAALWKVFGVSVGVERALGILAHLGVAFGTGWVVGLMRGTRFSAATAGVVLVWLGWLGAPAYAWLLALACAVLACGLAMRASATPSRGAWIAAGSALGAVGCFRHDLFVYFVAGLLALAAARALVTRRFAVTPSERSALGWITLGAAVPLALVWLPMLALAGLGTVIADLYFTQVQHVMPARVLPMPELMRPATLPPLPFQLPAFIARGYEGAVALTLAGPAFALVAVALTKRLALRGTRGPLLILALSVAVLPQMIGRSDPYHAFLTTAPALLLLCALLESLGRGPGIARAIVVAGTVAVLGIPVSMQLEIPDAAEPAAWQQEYPRYGSVPEPEGARETVLAFVTANTSSGEPIYVGLADHSRVFVNEMDLYYLAERPGATRIMQFDPNVVNREDVQRQMAAEIESSTTQVAILSSRYSDQVEPNESNNRGSSFLDEYLRSEFEVVAHAGPYQLLRRRSP
jgi:hypothetical protein